MEITKENYRKLKMEHLVTWATNNNAAAVDWLCAQIPDVENKKLSYLMLKLQFCEKFIPDIVPEKKASASVSMLDQLKALAKENSK